MSAIPHRPDPHAPMRTCVACRARRAQGELLRVVRRPDESVAIDDGVRAQGRGAYLCRDAACVGRALRRNALHRALRVPLPPALLARLEEGGSRMGGGHGA